MLIESGDAETAGNDVWRSGCSRSSGDIILVTIIPNVIVFELPNDLL